MGKAGRPKKPVADLRCFDLRIPVTESGKRLLQAAAQIDSERGELAEWARSVLLENALWVFDERGLPLPQA
jgi:hypothetical protein